MRMKDVNYKRVYKHKENKNIVHFYIYFSKQQNRNMTQLVFYSDIFSIHQK